MVHGGELIDISCEVSFIIILSFPRPKGLMKELGELQQGLIPQLPNMKKGVVGGTIAQQLLVPKSRRLFFKN